MSPAKLRVQFILVEMIDPFTQMWFYVLYVSVLLIQAVLIKTYFITWTLILFHACHMEKYLSLAHFFGIKFIIRFEVKQQFSPSSEAGRDFC